MIETLINQRYVEGGTPIEQSPICPKCGKPTHKRVMWYVPAKLTEGMLDNAQMYHRMDLTCDIEGKRLIKAGVKDAECCHCGLTAVETYSDYNKNMHIKTAIQDMMPPRWANIRLENSDKMFPLGDEIVKRYCEKLDEMTEKHAGLLLVGGHGVGKTWIVSAICDYAIREKGKKILFIAGLGDEYERYRAAKFSPKPAAAITEYWQNVMKNDIIIVDDYGAEELRPDRDDVLAWFREFGEKLYNGNKLVLATACRTFQTAGSEARDAATAVLKKLCTNQISLEGDERMHKK